LDERGHGVDVPLEIALEGKRQGALNPDVFFHISGDLVLAVPKPHDMVDGTEAPNRTRHLPSRSLAGRPKLHRHFYLRGTKRKCFEGVHDLGVAVI
jgi:hypothetical protein